MGELIRYLEHPRSGALEFEDMGPSWVSVRNAASARTLRASDSAVLDVVHRFDGLLRFAGLRLGRRLGTEVSLSLSRKELAEPAIRAAAQTRQLEEAGLMTGAIRVPDAVGPLNLTVDLRSSQVRCHVDIDAPREGRAITRVNWLVRQLRRAPEDVRVEASVLHSRGPGATDLLKVVRENPGALVDDPSKEFKSFRIIQSSPLGTKRGGGQGSFIASVTDAVDDFYENVVQYLKAWSAAPPRYRTEDVPAEAPEEFPSALQAAALSSQDGPEEVPKETTSTAP